MRFLGQRPCQSSVTPSILTKFIAPPLWKDLLCALAITTATAMTTNTVMAGEIYIYENSRGQKLFSDRKLSKPGFRLIKKQGSSGRMVAITSHKRNNQRRIGIPSPSREPFRVRAKKFDHFINWAARSYDLDPALIRAVIRAESAYDHNATSHAGAQGLMQLMPATARSYGVTNSYNPHQNIMGGSKHLRHLIDKHNGNLELVLAEYNAGGVAVKKYNGIPPFKETQDYVKKVIKFYKRYANQQKTTRSQNALASS